MKSLASFRYLGMCLALAAAASLGACATSPGGTTAVVTTPTPADVASTTAAVVTDVQTATVTACKFLPAAGTVASIVATGSISATAGVTLAKAIAAAICGSVGYAPAARRGAFLPTVAGVPIVGEFVR